MRTFALLLLCFIASVTQAQTETSKTFGNYTVHYIAVNSTFIDADIAAKYHITRSKRGAFLNIAVLRNDSDGKTTPVTAKLSGGKSNLMQQSGQIAFQEIREGDAIYYIGQFDFSNAETLRFNVKVQPESKGETYSLEWTTQLYAD
ncbi:MAG TPA: DUF4426 domain-containing protein [Candidatus Acidoferrum sp.]|nr:DUF4426 domain-containing protein [Candidatus Acidoferrum sp.]